MFYIFSLPGRSLWACCSVLGTHWHPVHSKPGLSTFFPLSFSSLLWLIIFHTRLPPSYSNFCYISYHNLSIYFQLCLHQVTKMGYKDMRGAIEGIIGEKKTQETDEEILQIYHECKLRKIIWIWTLLSQWRWMFSWPKEKPTWQFTR